MCTEKQIVPGITISESGEATVDPLLADTLFDLAVQLEEPTKLPVDVEHVLAAVVLAVRSGELDSKKILTSEDPLVISILTRHVKTVFADFNGNVGAED